MQDRITPMLWFDHQAEEAAQFYTSIFRNARITGVSRYGEAGPGPKGTAMVVEFELDGRPFTALNGGPHFKFTEAISLVVNCADQQEVDYYWSRLTEGGAEAQCGWLKDKYGLSWQVVPTPVIHMLKDPDAAKSARVMQAVMKMIKIDVAEASRAYAQG